MNNLEKLLQFIDDSPSAYHSVKNASELLIKEGYIFIPENKKFNLEKGGKYFTTRNGTSLIAFKIGKDNILAYDFQIDKVNEDEVNSMLLAKSCAFRKNLLFL